MPGKLKFVEFAPGNIKDSDKLKFVGHHLVWRILIC